MTESEVIKVLEKPSKHIRMVHKTKNEMEFYTYSSDLVEAFEKAISALEEIQQYRAMEEKLRGITVKEVVEHFIKTVENQTEEEYTKGRILTNKEAEEWEQLKEKATAKKVRGISLTHEGRVGNCPSCGSFIRNQEQTLYCDCGQHLDWSEGKE